MLAKTTAVRRVETARMEDSDLVVVVGVLVSAVELLVPVCSTVQLGLEVKAKTTCVEAWLTSISLIWAAMVIWNLQHPSAPGKMVTVMYLASSPVITATRIRTVCGSNMVQLTLHNLTVIILSVLLDAGTESLQFEPVKNPVLHSESSLGLHNKLVESIQRGHCGQQAPALLIHFS